MGRRPRLRELPPEQRTVAAPRQLLALSGGGFRGLFTARVLELLETEAGGPIKDRFDVLGGTSIGGIVAIALACGISAGEIRARFAQDGPTIFRRRLTRIGGFLGARYSPKPLLKSVAAILGPWAMRPFADIPMPVLVVAIEERTGQPRVFRSRALDQAGADSISVLDIALATSAAPTFFPPHHIGRLAFVDGGLIANAPDLVLTAEAMRCFGAPLLDLAICSIGTAGSPRNGAVGGDPGASAWLLRHGLVELAIDAQAALTADQLQRLGPRDVLRIDAAPRTPLRLDDASPQAAQALQSLAEQAVNEIKATRLAHLRRFLAHTPRAPQTFGG